MGNGRRIRRRLTPDPKPRPAPKSGFKGRYNVYACPHKHYTVTIDVDDGTTPVFLGCRRKPWTNGKERCQRCGNMTRARSSSSTKPV